MRPRTLHLARAVLAAALLLTTLPAAPARAFGEPAGEIPPLETDRPDFTESAVVVPRFSLQIESGFTYENGSDGVNAFNLPELLLRYGLLERTELRFQVPDYVRLRGGERTSGFGDTVFGLKHQLGPVGRLDLAVIAAASLPTGATAFTTGGVDPEFSFIWGRDLDEKWSLGGQFNIVAPRAGGGREFAWGPTVVLNRALTARLETFLEYFGEYAGGGSDIHILHHGYAYSLSPVSQVDVHLGFGVSRAAPDFFVGGGYVVRF